MLASPPDSPTTSTRRNMDYAFPPFALGLPTVYERAGFDVNKNRSRRGSRSSSRSSSRNSSRKNSFASSMGSPMLNNNKSSTSLMSKPNGSTASLEKPSPLVSEQFNKFKNPGFEASKNEQKNEPKTEGLKTEPSFQPPPAQKQRSPSPSRELPRVPQPPQGSQPPLTSQSPHVPQGPQGPQGPQASVAPLAPLSSKNPQIPQPPPHSQPQPQPEPRSELRPDPYTDPRAEPRKDSVDRRLESPYIDPRVENGYIDAAPAQDKPFELSDEEDEASIYSEPSSPQNPPPVPPPHLSPLVIPRRSESPKPITDDFKQSYGGSRRGSMEPPLSRPQSVLVDPLETRQLESQPSYNIEDSEMPSSIHRSQAGDLTFDFKFNDSTTSLQDSRSLNDSSLANASTDSIAPLNTGGARRMPNLPPVEVSAQTGPPPAFEPPTPASVPKSRETSPSLPSEQFESRPAEHKKTNSEVMHKMYQITGEAPLSPKEPTETSSTTGPQPAEAGAGANANADSKAPANADASADANAHANHSANAANPGEPLPVPPAPVQGAPMQTHMSPQMMSAQMMSPQVPMPPQMPMAPQMMSPQMPMSPQMMSPQMPMSPQMMSPQMPMSPQMMAPPMMQQMPPMMPRMPPRGMPPAQGMMPPQAGARPPASSPGAGGVANADVFMQPKQRFPRGNQEPRAAANFSPSVSSSGFDNPGMPGRKRPPGAAANPAGGMPAGGMPAGNAAQIPAVQTLPGKRGANTRAMIGAAHSAGDMTMNPTPGRRMPPPGSRPMMPPMQGMPPMQRMPMQRMPPMQGMMPPMQRMPPMQGMMPPMQGMMPPMQGMMPPMQGMMPPMQGMVPPMQGMMPPMQGMVPPQMRQMQGVPPARSPISPQETESSNNTSRSQSSSNTSVQDEEKGVNPPTGLNLLNIPQTRRVSASSSIYSAQPTDADGKTHKPGASQSSSVSFDFNQRHFAGAGGADASGVPTTRKAASHRVSTWYGNEEDEKNARLPPPNREKLNMMIHSNSTSDLNGSGGAKRRRQCRGCMLPITGKSVRAQDGTLSGRWHRECFKCTRCGEALGIAGEIHVLNDQPFCEACYHIANNTTCRMCGEGIEGSCLETRLDQDGEQPLLYHVHCLRCAQCNLQLQHSYFDVGGQTFCAEHAFTSLPDDKAVHKRYTQFKMI